jgi:cytoskeleton protein RodZ
MTEQQQLIPLCMGERLSQKRQKRKLDLADVARQLRIDLPVMEAIENDRLDHLAPVYQRGYITSYARFLGFDQSEIDQMLETIGYESPELHTVFPEAGNPNQADRWLKATSYVLASLLVGTLAWQFAHEAVRLSQDGIELVRNDPVDIDAGPVNQQTSTAGQPEPATHVNASIAALGILRNQRAARSETGNVAWEALDQAPVETGEPTVIEEVAAVEAEVFGEYTLRLVTSGDSWVEMTDANGIRLEVDLVRAGSDKEYRGKAPFRIQFGRPKAISLYMDGEEIDLMPFTSNGVIQMSLDGSHLKSASTNGSPDNG